MANFNLWLDLLDNLVGSDIFPLSFDYNLFDNCIEGIKLKNKPVFSVQYHPESNPGPQDSHYLFKQFINEVIKNAKKKRS